MKRIKSIGLVAHDAKKQALLDWVRDHAELLAEHDMFCTGTTGKLISQMLEDDFPTLKPKLTLLKSGPLGGDQQMGALIADGSIDVLFFFTDPMTTQPHDVDIKALMRICAVYDVVIACTRSTADFVISSPLFGETYEPVLSDYSAYLGRLAPEK